MICHFALTVDWPEMTIEEGSIVELSDAKLSLISEGIPQEMHVPLLLMAADSLQREVIRAALEQQLPLMSGEVLDSMAMVQARLNMVDQIMHLPLNSSDWTTSTL